MRYVAVIALLVAASLSAYGQDRLVTEDQLRAMNFESLLKNSIMKEVDARGDDPIPPFEVDKFAEDKLWELWGALPELRPIPDDAHAESAQEQAAGILDALFPADEDQPALNAAQVFVVLPQLDEPNLPDPSIEARAANIVMAAIARQEEENRIKQEIERRLQELAEEGEEIKKQEDLRRQNEALLNAREEQKKKQEEAQAKAGQEAKKKAEEAYLKRLDDDAKNAQRAKEEQLKRAEPKNQRAKVEELYKKPSIWPAWVGAVPAYSAAYSEVAPARIAGFKALYEGEARGVDLDGNAVDGLFSVEFHSGGGDAVNMLGTLLGLEFGSVLSANSGNSFSAVTDPGTADTSAGPGEFYGTGRLQGKFYGAGHEAVGGTFNLYGASDVTGHFVGSAP